MFALSPLEISSFGEVYKIEDQLSTYQVSVDNYVIGSHCANVICMYVCVWKCTCAYVIRLLGYTLLSAHVWLTITLINRFIDFNAKR